MAARQAQVSEYKDYLFDNRYKGVKKLGEGGYGSAVMCIDMQTQMTVVVKVATAMTEDVQTAAVKEAKLLSQLDHPNVLRYLDHFCDPKGFCLVTEYATAGDLGRLFRQCQKEGRKLATEEAAAYFAQIMMALEYLHGRQVMHRDLKPGNVFLFKDGLLKLGDLGIAREIGMGEASQTWQGTPGYAAPELYRHMPYRMRVDIWSAGALLWELLVLRPAYTGKGATEIQRRVLQGLPDRPKDVDPDLIRLSEWMMAINPEQRPSIAEVMGNQSVQRACLRLAGMMLPPTERAPGGVAFVLPEDVPPEAQGPFDASVRKGQQDWEDCVAGAAKTCRKFEWDLIVDAGDFRLPLLARRKLIVQQLVDRVGDDTFKKVTRIYRRFGIEERSRQIALLANPKLTQRVQAGFECLMLTENLIRTGP